MAVGSESLAAIGGDNVDVELTENKHIMCSIPVAAVQLGLAASTLREWINTHDFPKDGKLVDLTNILKERRETAEALSTKEGQIIYTDAVQDALTSLFAEIQGKCLASDNTSESDLLLLGVPQDTVTEYMRKRRERTNAMLTEFASGGQSAFTPTVGEKPKRSYTKRQTSVPAATTGNSKRMGRPQ